MKKGQLEMQESIVVIFIVIVLILLGFIFFYRFTMIDIQNQVNRYEDYKFRQLINVIPNMAEIKCSKLAMEMECIDTSKLDAYVRLNSNYNFGFKNITIKEMYLPNPNKWQFYLKTPNKYTNVLKVSSPVSLYYPNQDKYGFGLLIIEWYK